MIRILREFFEGHFDINDVVKKQHNTADTDSEISLDEDIYNSPDHDENDMFRV